VILNIQHGIKLTNWWKGIVSIEQTLISENIETGILVKNDRIPMLEIELDQSELETSRGLIETDDVVLGKIWVLRGTEVCHNDAGLRLQNCLFYIDEDYSTKIYDNMQLD
jgi:hypothetical protein